MPRVPEYNLPQVEAQPLPAFRQESVASPGLFSKAADDQIATGGLLMKAGALLNDWSIRVQERQNADMLFRAETAVKDEYLDFSTKASERKGQNAWGLTKDAEAWWDDAARRHGENMENDVQRTLFNQTVNKLRLQSLDTMSVHEANERRKSLDESARASIAGSINLAAGDFDNPVTLTGAKTDVLKRVQAISELNGWSPERRDAEQAQFLTSLHKQVIQAKIAADPQGARDYYEINKNEINGADRDGVERVVREGTLREVTQKATDEIVALGLPIEQALSKARSQFKGHDEDEIVRRVKERYAEAEVVKQRDQRDAANDAWKAITAGGGRSQIPAQVWTRLGGEEQRQILDYVDMRARRAQAVATRDGKAELDDFENLDKVERMIEVGDITERGQLARYAPYFSRQTLKTLATKIERRGTVSPTVVQKSFEDRLGKTRAKWGDDERAQWLAYQDYIYNNVKETKRPEDVDSWADQWFTSGYGTQDAWWRPDPETYGKAVTKGRKDFLIPVPEDRRPLTENVLALLKKNGVAVPTMERITRPGGRQAVDEFYTRYQMNAERWLAARNVPSSPQAIGAYALLKQAGKPITADNMAYVSQQLGATVPYDPSAFMSRGERGVEVLKNSAMAFASGLPNAGAGIAGTMEAAADALSHYVTGPLTGTVLPEDIGARVAEAFAASRRRQTAVRDAWMPQAGQALSDALPVATKAKDVPAALRTQLEAVLTQAGMPVTDDNLLKVYGELQRRLQPPK